jgi:hypothetical protein
MRPRVALDTTSVAYVLCRIEDDSSLTLVSEHEELSAGIKAGRHMVEVEDHDFRYGLYTSDMAARVARFAEGRVGYREWARRRGDRSRVSRPCGDLGVRAVTERPR